MPPLLAHRYPVASGRPAALPVLLPPIADCFNRFSAWRQKAQLRDRSRRKVGCWERGPVRRGEGRKTRARRPSGEWVRRGVGWGGVVVDGLLGQRRGERGGEGLSCRASPPRDGGGSPVTQDLTGRRCQHHLRRRRTWRRLPQFPKQESSLFRFVTSLSSPRRRGLGGARKCVQVPSAKAAANKFASLPS